MRYNLYTVLILGAFALLEWRGINLLPTGNTGRVPTSMRSSPGGYRSYQTWTSRGFHGGK
jgi:hypothetical protein